jgi:hypothetical protein
MAITKSHSTTPASEDTQQLAAAQASREAFAAAQDLAAERQSAHDTAELASAEMESQFSQGNDSATASDYATALAEVTRTELLHNAAQAAEKAAETGVISTDVTLAHLAQPWVQSALKGVEVKATFYTPKTSPDKPVAYVIQSKPTEDLRGGSVAGKVEVRYYRPDLYRAVDAGDIQDAAERAHCTVMATSSGRHFADMPVATFTQNYGADMKVDTVMIDIKRGQSPTPLIKDDPTSTLASSNVSHAFAADLAASCQAPTDGPVRGINREFVGSAITAKALAGKITGMEVDDAGVRTTTVKLDLTYHREGVRVVNVDTHLKELLTDWKGSFVTSFGMVSSITGRSDFKDPVGDTAITVEITFVSRIR